MKEIIEGLKGVSKWASRVNKLLIIYSQLKEKPVENAYLVEKKLTEILKATSNLPDFGLKNALMNWVNQEKTEIEKAKNEFRFLFGEQIKNLFQQDNKAIKGQFPILRIGFYTVVLNFEFGEATLYFGPEIEKIRSKIPLEPGSIHSAIKKFDEDLKRTKFEPKEFYLDLQKAYKNRIIVSNRSYGEKVLLIDALNEYVLLKQPSAFFVDPKKENFREFPRISLAYLLYLFRRSDFSQKGVHLYVATFDATTDKKQALWIPDNEEGEGTYYSYVSFEGQ